MGWGEIGQEKNIGVHVEQFAASHWLSSVVISLALATLTITVAHPSPHLGKLCSIVQSSSVVQLVAPLCCVRVVSSC
jgi:hypothetical protein